MGKSAWNENHENGLKTSILLDIVAGRVKEYSDIAENKWEVAKRATQFTHPGEFKSRRGNVEELPSYAAYRPLFTSYIESENFKGI